MAVIKKGNIAKKVLIGAGLAAGAALAAYLLTTPKSRQKAATKVKGWMRDMQKDIAGKVKAVESLTQQKYNSIVDEVKPKYEALKDVSSTELESFSKEMKSHWDNISGAIKKTGNGKKAKK